MSHDPEEIKKHVKIYISVFAALAFLTIITVTVSYLHLSPVQTVIVALLIAAVKASLVACFFMHLISEKKAILYILLLTLIFLLLVLVIPAIKY